MMLAIYSTILGIITSCICAWIGYKAGVRK
jgi:hypothetical protein